MVVRRRGLSAKTRRTSRRTDAADGTAHEPRGGNCIIYPDRAQRPMPAKRASESESADDFSHNLTTVSSVRSERSPVRRRMFNDDDFFSLPIKYVVYVCSGLPLAAMVICVALASTIHYEGATRTHCGVTNWLPSISAAIGDYTPERYIWRILIAMHSAPRFGVAFAYKNFFISSPLRPFASLESSWFRALCYFCCFLNIAENFFLLLLSCVSSTENHSLHQVCFISFAVCAKSYMLLSLYLFHYSGRRRTSSLGEKSFQYKMLMFSISLVALTFSGYFFYRHNAYCEPGIYTLFAMSEYIVVVTNVLFHSTLYYDFYGKKLILTSSAGFDYEPLLPALNTKAT